MDDKVKKYLSKNLITLMLYYIGESFFDIKHFINKYRLHEHVYIEYQL